MIFKTIDNNGSGIKNELTILGNSLSDITNAFQNGGIKGTFSKLSPFISTTDLNNVREYNRLVKEEGVSSQTAWYRTMQTSSNAMRELFNNESNLVETSNGVIMSEEAIANATNNMTLKAKAASLGIRALATVANVALTVAITGAISVIYNCINASKNLQKAAGEAGSEFKTTKESIEDYRQKIADLHETIDSSTASYEETYSAREELLKIQDEMIEKFGDEAGAIAEIKEAIKGTNEAFDELTQTEWYQILNKFNSNTGDGLWGKIAHWLTHDFGTSTNSDKMMEEMDSIKETFGIPESAQEEYKKFIDELKRIYGDDISVNSNEYSVFDEIGVTGKNLKDIYDKMLVIQDLGKKMGMEDSFFTKLSEKTGDIKNKLDTYDEMYTQSVFANKVLTDDALTEKYKEISQAYKDYQKIFKNGGTEEDVEVAKQKVAKLIQETTNGLTDQSVIDFFNEMYPDLQDVVGKWKFKIDFESNKEGLGDDIRELLSHFSTSDEIKNFNAKSNPENVEYYTALEAKARKYGLTIDQLINKLEELGKIQSQRKIDLVDKLVLSDESKKITDWGLDEYEKQIKDGTVQTKFGNVDMDKRTIIHWSDELKQTYANALASWDYDPEVGSIDTVFGGSERFGKNLNGAGWEVAFTPILPNGTFLSKDTVEEYINSIIAEAYADDGKVTEDELTAIDTQGRQIGNTFVQGIFAGIDDSLNYDDNGNQADVAGRLMHFVGKFGAVSLAKNGDDNKDVKEQINKFVSGLSEDDLKIAQTEDFDKALEAQKKNLNGATLSLENYQVALEEAKKANPTVNLDTDTLTEKIDEIQNAYKTLRDAIKEYNKEGYISVDTFQSIIGLGAEYLKYLVDENGNLKLDEQALQNVTIARIQDMVVAQKIDILDIADEWTSEADALKYLKSSLDDASDSYDEILNKRIQALRLKWTEQTDENGNRVWTDEQIENSIAGITKQFNSLDGIGNSAINGIKSGLGMTGESAKDNADKIKDIKKELDDLAKSEALDKLKYKFDKIEQSISKIDTALSLLNDIDGLTYEDDYIGKIEIASEQMELAQNKAKALAQEFNELSSQEYNSGSQASELANRMKSTADSINENQKQIIEYGKNITSYYMSALKSINSMSTATLNRATSLIERNIKTLSEGGLTGLEFSFSPNIPQSAIEKQRSENQSLLQEMQNYYTATAEMQKNALDLEFQEQVADNARKKEELLKQLAEQQTAINDYFVSVKTEQQTFNTETTSALNNDLTTKTNAINSALSTIKESVSETINWLKSNPISITTSSNDKLIDIGPYSGAGSQQSVISAIKGASLATEAAKYIGTPYVWGGTDLSKGVDCSGFVQSVYKNGGIDIPRTANEQYISDKGRNIVSTDALNAGDLIFFDFEGSGKATHVGMYLGGGKMIHAPTTGQTVKEEVDIFNNRYWSNHYLGGKRFYATGTHNYGIAGENYKLEWAVDKKTGQWFKIDSPTVFDRDKYDIIGEKTSKEIDKPLPMFATGTPISDPKVREMVKKASESTGVPANIILSVIDQESGNTWAGKVKDSNGYSYGYMQLYDKGSLTEVPQNSRLAAMNDPETNILWGAKYLKKMHDAVGGNWADAASAYNQGLGNFKKNGRNAYGDEVYNRATSSAFVEAAKQIGATTPLISSIATNTSNTASSTSLIAKKDFKSELREIIAGNNPQATGSEDSKVSEGLLSFIQEKMKEQEFNDQDFINKFEAMAQYNEDAKTVFADYEKKLSEARGTDNYEQIRGEISTQAGEYVKSLIGIQANMTAEKAAQDYNTAKTVQEYTLEYYLKRKNDKTNPANATELKQIIERYSEVTEDLESYSDTYVSTIKSHTDYLVSTLGNNLKEYDDQLTWQDNLAEGLERKIKLTSNLNEQRDLRNELLDSEWNKMSIYDNQKTDAHQAVLKLRADDSYAPVFKKLAELGISVEDWFDAQGNTSAQFEKDKTQFSINAPELVPVINQIAEVIKTAKQQWYNANQQQEGIFENIKSTLQENFEKDREPIQSDIEISQWISNMFSDKSFALKNTEYMKQLGSEFNLLNELIREKKELDSLYKAGKIRAADYTEQVKNLDSEIRNNLSDVKSLLQTIYQNQLDDIEEKINEIQDDSSKITDEIQYQINKLEDEKDLLQEQADKWQSAVNAVKKVISDQLDALNDEKDSAADYWQDQIDAVQKLNDETNRNIELNKTKKDLEKAESQKVSLIYKDGKLVYMANQADVDEARQNYSDKVREIDQEKAIEILEEQRDLQAKNYEDKIKQLEDYQKKWEEVLDKYSNYVDETNAEELLGYNFREDIANKDLGLLDITSDAYYKLESQIEGYLQKRIDKLNKEIKAQENATNETVRNLNKQKDAIEDTEVEWNKLYDTIVTMFKEGKTTSIPGIIQNFCEKFGTYFDKLDATGLGEAIVDVVNKQLGVVGNTSNNTSNSTNNVDSTVYKDYSAANSFKDGINALDKERDSGKITKDEYNIKLGELANKLGAVWESGSDGGFNVGGYKVNYDKGIWDIVGNDNIDNNLNSDTSTTNKNNSNHDTDGLVNTDKNGNLTQSKSDEEKRAEAIQKAKDSLSDWKKANKTRGCDNKEVYDSVPEAFVALKGNMTGNLLSYGFIYKVGDSYRTAYFSKGNGSLSTGIDVFNAYRKGTDSAKSGYALINEPINNNGNLNGEIVNFRGGEQVIDADKSIKLINGLRELTDDGSPLYKALTGSLTEIGVPDLRPKSLFDGVNPLDIKRNTVNTDNSVHIDQIVMNEVDNVRDFTRQLQRELPSVMSQINRLK